MSVEIRRNCWSNGNVRCEYPYQNSKCHGIAKGWHGNGNLHYTTTYRNNQRHGIAKGWHANGEPEYEGYYLYGEVTTEEEWRKHELIEELSCLER